MRFSVTLSDGNNGCFEMDYRADNESAARQQAENDWPDFTVKEVAAK